MPGFSKVLVIDTCVARASGQQDATHHMSKSCRTFLNTVIAIPHYVVMTPELRAEWRRHASRFSRTWLVSMERKGKVKNIETPLNSELREKLRNFALNEALNVDQILKDVHLLEASMSVGQRIVSYERYVRRQYAKAAQGKLPELRPIMWVDPCIDSENPLTWLQSGAGIENPRTLGEWQQAT